jgi:hypothetical protein
MRVKKAKFKEMEQAVVITMYGWMQNGVKNYSKEQQSVRQ